MTTLDDSATGQEMADLGGVTFHRTIGGTADIHDTT